jgi:hypothetical protein
VSAPFGEVDGPRCHPAGMKCHAQRIGRRLEQLGSDPLDERAERVVGRHQLVVAVDDDRRVGLVGAQEAVERLVHGRHLGLLERTLDVQRGVAGREQQAVALAQRNVQVLGQPEHHLAARPCASRLQEADVARGDVGFECQLELAQAAAPAPRAQKLPNRGPLGLRLCERHIDRHGSNVARTMWRRNYSSGNGTPPARVSRSPGGRRGRPGRGGGRQSTARGRAWTGCSARAFRPLRR